MVLLVVQRLEAGRMRVVVLLGMVPARRGLVPPEARERRGVRGGVRAERVVARAPCTRSTIPIPIRRRRRMRVRARRARVVARMVLLAARRREERAREDLRVVLLLLVLVLLVMVMLLRVMVLQVVRGRLRREPTVALALLAGVDAEAERAGQRGHVHGRLAAELRAPPVVMMRITAVPRAAAAAAWACAGEPRGPRRPVRAPLPARVVGPPAVHVVRVLRVEVVLQLLRLVEVELLFVLLFRSVRPS